MIQSESQYPLTAISIPLCWISLLFVMLVTPLYLEAQSLDEYQLMAAENNPEVEAAFQDYMSALEESPQAGTLLDPEVAFAYFISPVETRLGPQQARISLTQMFPWFGSLQDKRSATQARAEARYQAFQEVRNRVFYQTEETWVKLYELEQSIRIARENLQILNSLVEVSLRRYETNQSSQVDVLRAQIEQEDLNTQIALLEDNKEVLISRMNELLNRDNDKSVHPADTLMAVEALQSESRLRNQLINQNPGLNRLRYQEDSARELRSLASRQTKPTMGLGLDYIFVGERKGAPDLQENGKDALMARASFRIPLFRKANHAKVQQAEREMQAVQSKILSRENQLETDLHASLRDFYDAQRRFILYDRKQIQRVEQALSIMTQNYATDSSNFEEILRMQRKLLDYQLNRIQALADIRITSAYIDYLTGTHNISTNDLN